MWNYVYVPFLGPNTMWESPFEDKKRVYDQLVEWWGKNKETAYWHRKHQCLVAKGESPEEVEVAAVAERKAKEEAEIKAKLDAELTEDDLKRITSALVRKFEARMQYLADFGNKTLGADSGCKFEKVGDAEWHHYVRQSNPGPLYRRTITGPTVRKWRDRKFPLVAEFKCVVRNLDTGKDSEDKMLYHYRKLEDLWSEGPPPK
jgi:hypothetical protein